MKKYFFPMLCLVVGVSLLPACLSKKKRAEKVEQCTKETGKELVDNHEHSKCCGCHK